MMADYPTRGLDPWDDELRGYIDGQDLLHTLDPLRYDSTDMRTWRIALAKVAVAPADAMVLGDSVVEGQGSSAVSKRFVDLLLADLRDKYQPAGVVGGEGYVPSAYIASGVADRWVYTGVTSERVDLGGLGERVVRMEAGATATLDFTGTSTKILYEKGPTAGQFEWTIDGGAATNVAANQGTVAGGQVENITGLSAGPHTLVITALSNFTYLEGGGVFNGDESAGVRMWGAGHSGWQTDDFATPGLVNAYDSIAAVQPSLFLGHLGLNDYGSQSQARRTPAEMKASLASINAQVRAVCTIDPSIVWVIPYERGVVPTVLAPWSEYRIAIEEFAAEDGQTGLIDMGPPFGPYWAAATDPYNLDDGDFVHPNDQGHRLMADTLFPVLG